MSNDFIQIQVAGGVGPRFAEMAKRVSDLSPCGELVLAAMRRGKGGVLTQFSAQAEFLPGGGQSSWPPTQPFGQKQPPPATLVRSGSLRDAWGGGSESVSEVSQNRFAIGVSGAGKLGIIAHVFNRRDADVTVVRANPSNRTKRGRLAMQVALGMQFGAWISEAKLLAGLNIPVRRVSFNPLMRADIVTILRLYVLTGQLGNAAAQGAPVAKAA